MSGKMKNFNGIPTFIPNDITANTDEFYISYNDRDISIYGSVTTALVLNKPLKFLILNGKHSKAYNDIISMGGGYAQCLEYFKSNIDKKSKYSENWNETLVLDKNGLFHVIKDF